MNKNPFFFREISRDEPFCNREKEFQDLIYHAESLTNVVVYSPRRFGKTSLVKRVQNKLGEDGAVCIYVDFFGVSTIEDVAERLAKTIFKAAQKEEPLFNKAIRTIKSFRPSLTVSPNEKTGFSMSVQMASVGLTGFALLEDLLESFGLFIEKTNKLVYVCLDEFQDLTILKDALKIEGLMRQYIQQHKAAYVFVGSRRRMLLSIFNDSQRAFYGSALNYELKPLPKKEFAAFIAEMFNRNGKPCGLEAATELVTITDCFPYYAQKLAYIIFQEISDTVELEDIEKGLNNLLVSETPVFEGILMGLSIGQVGLLKALAHEPTETLFTQEYIQRHRLGSIGGVQSAKKKLQELDLIEEKSNTWALVDPLFKVYLSTLD